MVLKYWKLGAPIYYGGTYYDSRRTEVFEYEVKPEVDDVLDFLEIQYPHKSTDEELKLLKDGSRRAIKAILDWGFVEEMFGHPYFIDFMRGRYQVEAEKEAGCQLDWDKL